MFMSFLYTRIFISQVKMEYKSADSISEVFVSTDLDNLSVANSQNVSGSPNTDTLKKCPVCKADERYFALNLDEKILLCENPECDYPFGYTKLQFAKQEELCHTANKVDSITNIGNGQVPPGSIKSSNGWFLATCDSEHNRQKTNKSNIQDKIVNPETAFNSLKHRQAEIEAKAGVQQIKKLKNKMQKRYQTEQVSFISNKEYIQHLKKLQGSKGDMVKKLEISRILSDEAGVAPVDTSGITFELLQHNRKRTDSNEKKKRPGVGRIEWIPCNSLYGGRL